MRVPAIQTIHVAMTVHYVVVAQLNWLAKKFMLSYADLKLICLPVNSMFLVVSGGVLSLEQTLVMATHQFPDCLGLMYEEEVDNSDIVLLSICQCNQFQKIIYDYLVQYTWDNTVEKLAHQLISEKLIQQNGPVFFI